MERVANTAKDFLGIDEHGIKWYGEIQKDGKQVWVQVRKGKIIDGGINEKIRPWSPKTGLKKESRGW